MPSSDINPCCPNRAVHLLLEHPHMELRFFFSLPPLLPLLLLLLLATAAAAAEAGDVGGCFVSNVTYDFSSAIHSGDNFADDQYQCQVGGGTILDNEK